MPARPDHSESALAERAASSGLLSNTRFYLRLTLLVILVVLAQVGLMFWLVQHAFATLTPTIEQDLRWKALSGVEELRHSADLGVLTSDTRILETASKRYADDPDVLYLGFRNAQGKLLFKRGQPDALSASGPASTVTETDSAYRTSAPIEVEGLRVGSVELAISKARLSAGSRLHQRLLWVGAIGAAIALGLALLFVQIYILPLLRLTHRAFDELKSTTELAVASNEAKSRFLANMSHEIRTPMNGLLGILQLVGQTPLNATQQRYLQIMHSSGRSLLRIVNDILDVSKLEAKKYALHPTSCSLRTLIRETTDLFTPSAEKKGLVLTAHVADSVPDQLVMDDGRVRQILSNLLNNAIKFTEQGNVTLRVDAEHCSGSAGADVSRAQLSFEVTDSGVGIPDAAREKLFQPFSQVDESSTRAHQGTGLGLSIARRLAGLMGGELVHRHVEPHGSSFVFSMPLVRGNTSNEAVPKPTTHEGFAQHLSVLVVDDNEINQLVALEMLEQLGLEVELASGGRDALEYWQEGSYSAILMDCQMPEMDGYQTAREIRKREAEGVRVPIIACTAHAFEEERLKVKAAGMDDFIPKPLSTESLRQVLSRWLRLESSERQAPDPHAEPHAQARAEPTATGAIVDLLAPLSGQVLNPDQRPSSKTRELFLRLTPQTLAELKLGAREHRASDVKALAHKLKGSAAAIGAEQLAEMCDRLQQCAEHVDRSQLGASADLIERLHTAVVECLGPQKSLEAPPA